MDILTWFKVIYYRGMLNRVGYSTMEALVPAFTFFVYWAEIKLVNIFK